MIIMISPVCRQFMAGTKRSGLPEEMENLSASHFSRSFLPPQDLSPYGMTSEMNVRKRLKIKAKQRWLRQCLPRYILVLP